VSSACRVIPQLRIKLPSTYSHSVLGSTLYAHSRTRFSAFSTNFLLALNRQLMLAYISNVGQTLRWFDLFALCLLQLQARSGSSSVPAATAGALHLQLRLRPAPHCRAPRRLAHAWSHARMRSHACAMRAGAARGACVLDYVLLHVHHVHVSGYDATCQQMHAIILNLVCACGAACGARGACVYTAAPGYATKFSTKYSRHSSQY